MNSDHPKDQTRQKRSSKKGGRQRKRISILNAKRRFLNELKPLDPYLLQDIKSFVNRCRNMEDFNGDFYCALTWRDAMIDQWEELSERVRQQGYHGYYPATREFVARLQLDKLPQAKDESYDSQVMLAFPLNLYIKFTAELAEILLVLPSDFKSVPAHLQEAVALNKRALDWLHSLSHPSVAETKTGLTRQCSWSSWDEEVSAPFSIESVLIPPGEWNPDEFYEEEDLDSY